jgi:NAD(P)H-flavin reductase
MGSEMKTQTATRTADARNPMVPLEFEVGRVSRETHDTFTLFLNPVNGLERFTFQPGQFNMIYIYGVGEVPISISGNPHKPEVLVHTTRAVGTVTRAMQQLKRGDRVGIRGPFGAAWPVDVAEGRDVVFVAGGIGLAPLRPAIYHVLANRNRFGRIVLLYGARTPEDILYRKELEKWRARFDLEVHVTVDRATLDWRGNVGVVTKLIPKAPFDPYHCVSFICGPEIMMRFTVIELTKRGVPEDQVYISMERNMKCGIGLCGHCQYGPKFICKDGPVFRYDVIRDWFKVREL